jgi:hypothetical protein
LPGLDVVLPPSSAPEFDGAIMPLPCLAAATPGSLRNAAILGDGALGKGWPDIFRFVIFRNLIMLYGDT